MIGWVEASLYEAINCLTRLGKNDLASDLNRLLDTLDFDELEVFRNPASEAIADRLLEVSTFPDLVDLLRQFSEAIGVAHCTLHVVSELPSTAFTTRALTTYPEEWVTRYFDRRYHQIDPVVCASVTAEGGFFWDTLAGRRPRHAGLLPRRQGARRRPLGLHPADHHRARRQDRHLGQLARGPRGLPRAHPPRRAGPAQRRLLHHRGLLPPRLRGPPDRVRADRRPDGHPPRGGDGRRRRGAAPASYLYGSYSTLERSICTIFRTRTITQAAILAARVGLLTNAPLTKADILVGSSRAPTSRVVTSPNAASMRRLIKMRNVALNENDLAPELEWSPAY